MGQTDYDIITKWHMSNRQPESLLWQLNSGLIISASPLRFLSVFVESVKGQLQLRSWLREQQMSVTYTQDV